MPTIITNLRDYLRGAVEEMKKVTWPTKKQTTTYSFIVIGMSIGVAVFFGVLDKVFSFGLDLLIR